MSTIKWERTKYPSVRFYKHKTRKHGTVPDKNYSIRYRYLGKRYSEMVGWSSENWTPKTVHDLLAELKNNQVTGKGPATLKAKIQTLKEEQDLQEKNAFDKSVANKTIKERNGVTFTFHGSRKIQERIVIKLKKGRKPGQTPINPQTSYLFLIFF